MRKFINIGVFFIILMSAALGETRYSCLVTSKQPMTIFFLLFSVPLFVNKNNLPRRIPETYHNDYRLEKVMEEIKKNSRQWHFLGFFLNAQY